MTFNNMILM